MLIRKSSPSPNFDSLFERNTVSSTRGHSVKLVKHRCHLDLRKYFFCETVVIDRWNQLSEDCISCDTINRFKGKLDIVRRHKMGLFEDHTDLIGLHGRISRKSKDIRLLVWPHQVNYQVNDNCIDVIL